jgi:hypothetical protein
VLQLRFRPIGFRLCTLLGLGIRGIYHCFEKRTENLQALLGWRKSSLYVKMPALIRHRDVEVVFPPEQDPRKLQAAATGRALATKASPSGRSNCNTTRGRFR